MTPSRLRVLLDRGGGPVGALAGLQRGLAAVVLCEGASVRDRPARMALVRTWQEVATSDRVQRLLAARHPHVYVEGRAGYPIDDLPDRPAVLLAEGEAPEALRRRRVAVVGTRAATPHGLADAHELGAVLARAGITVVSGLAIGIDAAAHEGALGAGGAVVGVVATGLDVVYPRRHGALFDRVRRAGLLVSELGYGVGPRREAFPVRNRIIAGLAEAVVVVEATLKGGARITAERAEEYGRTVMAMPGSRRNPAAAGTNALDLRRRAGGGRAVRRAGRALADIGSGTGRPAGGALRRRGSRPRAPAAASRRPSISSPAAPASRRRPWSCASGPWSAAAGWNARRPVLATVTVVGFRRPTTEVGNGEPGDRGGRAPVRRPGTGAGVAQRGLRGAGARRAGPGADRVQGGQARRPQRLRFAGRGAGTARGRRGGDRHAPRHPLRARARGARGRSPRPVREAVHQRRRAGGAAGGGGRARRCGRSPGTRVPLEPGAGRGRRRDRVGRDRQPAPGDDRRLLAVPERSGGGDAELVPRSRHRRVARRERIAHPRSAPAVARAVRIGERGDGGGGATRPRGRRRLLGPFPHGFGHRGRAPAGRRGVDHGRLRRGDGHARDGPDRRRAGLDRRRRRHPATGGARRFGPGGRRAASTAATSTCSAGGSCVTTNCWRRRSGPRSRADRSPHRCRSRRSRTASA